MTGNRIDQSVSQDEFIVNSITVKRDKSKQQTGLKPHLGSYVVSNPWLNTLPWDKQWVFKVTRCILLTIASRELATKVYWALQQPFCTPERMFYVQPVSIMLTDGKWWGKWLTAKRVWGRHGQRMQASFYPLRLHDVSAYVRCLRVDSSFTKNVMQLDSGKSQGTPQSLQPLAIVHNVLCLQVYIWSWNWRILNFNYNLY